MQEPSTVQLRNSLRQTFRERRKALSVMEQSDAAKKLVQQCIDLKLFEHKTRVAVYLTNDGELSTLPLIEYLWSIEVEVYLPVLHPFCDGYLLFLRYTENSLMLANNFGILEPKLECHKICPVQALDVIFTPLVAFDDKGNRLGMGGGFYDRTLQAIHKENPVRLIGLAHDIQQTLALPIEVWDIPLPNIITPTRYFHFK